ncbi:hypothetical protein B0H14DRAFT_2624991 [Mycena olivaceomarginata]|nr:hypothetical protein B0H14DRAFT_2624991 [Mycena olivaceomarginata]
MLIHTGSWGATSGWRTSSCWTCSRTTRRGEGILSVSCETIDGLVTGFTTGTPEDIAQEAKDTKNGIAINTLSYGFQEQDGGTGNRCVCYQPGLKRLDDDDVNSSVQEQNRRTYCTGMRLG